MSLEFLLGVEVGKDFGVHVGQWARKIKIGMQQTSACIYDCRNKSFGSSTQLVLVWYWRHFARQAYAGRQRMDSGAILVYCKQYSSKHERVEKWMRSTPKWSVWQKSLASKAKIQVQFDWTCSTVNIQLAVTFPWHCRININIKVCTKN